jgi:hypothetical protein
MQGIRSAAARHRVAQHVVCSITLRFVLIRILKYWLESRSDRTDHVLRCTVPRDSGSASLMQNTCTWPHQCHYKEIFVNSKVDYFGLWATKYGWNLELWYGSMGLVSLAGLTCKNQRTTAADPKKICRTAGARLNFQIGCFSLNFVVLDYEY